MGRQDVIDYIRQCREKGYPDGLTRQWLFQNHYLSRDVDEAFAALDGKRSFPTKIILIVAAVLLLGVVVAAALFLGGPECGNGKVEKGEFSSNCCVDTGCALGSECENNVCVPLTCGYCEHLEGDECVTDECCTDAECDDSDNATRDVCTGSPKACSNTPITTCEDSDGYCPPGCSFVDDNDCAPIDMCTKDAECDDGIQATIDKCMGSPRKCEHVYTALCTDGDAYCPQGCSHEQDDDCSSDDACTTNVDCDDGDNATRDVCSGSPKACSNMPIVLCIDGDGYCPERCTFLSDDDCPEVDLCASAQECDDDDASTFNNCTGTPKRCVFTDITACAHGDGYCPPGCEWDDDHDCESPHECLIHEECDDGDNATKDVCTGDPKVCSNTPITSCEDSDGYCPQGCVYVEDNDCEELYDIILTGPIIVVDATTKQPMPVCGHLAAASFSVTSTFPSSVSVLFVDFKDGVWGTRLEKTIMPGTTTMDHFLGPAQNDFGLRIIVNTEEARTHSSDPAVLPENEYADNELVQDIGAVCVPG